MPKVATKHQANGEVKSVLSKLKLPKQEVATRAVWDGPCNDGTNGGVTQSLLNFYLMDLERFRIRTMEGLVEEPTFQHRLEYGNLWHIAEENYAAGKPYEAEVLKYAKYLMTKHRSQQSEILKWYNIVLATFPNYIKKWGKEKEQKSLLQEEVFHVPYKLSCSGRTVWLRGKFDSVHLFPKYLELQENKTPGDPNVEQIKRMLQFELQTMVYVIALQEYLKTVGIEEDKSRKVKLTALPIRVKYNIARRPLSGGKHSIKQKKDQTETEFYQELSERIASDLDFFFIRFDSQISEYDITRFKRTCLDPVLENLCDDYEWWNDCYRSKLSSKNELYDTTRRSTCFPEHIRRHYILPFGMYHPIAEGKGTYVDEYILSGGKSTRGLVTDKQLFPELQQEVV